MSVQCIGVGTVYASLFDSPLVMWVRNGVGREKRVVNYAELVAYVHTYLCRGTFTPRSAKKKVVHKNRL